MSLGNFAQKILHSPGQASIWQIQVLYLYSYTRKFWIFSYLPYFQIFQFALASKMHPCKHYNLCRVKVCQGGTLLPSIEFDKSKMQKEPRVLYNLMYLQEWINWPRWQSWDPVNKYTRSWELRSNSWIENPFNLSRCFHLRCRRISKYFWTFV